MDATQPTTSPCRNPIVETHLLPDGTCLLFNPESANGYVLNVAGSLVWDYCDGTVTIDEIAQELANLLPQQPGVREQTEQLLDEFADYGLLASSVKVHRRSSMGHKE